MKIKVTLEEIINNERVYLWEKFCEMYGWDYYCLHEGCDPNTEQEMTEEQAKELGILK